MSSPTDPTVAKLRAAGWTQGSVLPSALHAAAADRFKQEHGLELNQADWVVVVSHPCDVVNSRLGNEPWVECLRVQPTATVDGNKELGKNSRANHWRTGAVAPERPGVAALSALAIERFKLSRALLATAEPLCCLPPKEIQMLSMWLANRFRRPAFPDAFNENFPEGFKKFCKAMSPKIPSVAVAFSGHQIQQELDGADKYQVVLLVIYDNKDLKPTNPATEGKRIAAYFEDNPRICLRDVLIRSREEVTLDAWSQYVPLDFDYLSHRDNGGPFPPALLL